MFDLRNNSLQVRLEELSSDEIEEVLEYLQYRYRFFTIPGQHIVGFLNGKEILLYDPEKEHVKVLSEAELLKYEDIIPISSMSKIKFSIKSTSKRKVILWENKTRALSFGLNLKNHKFDLPDFEELLKMYVMEF